MIRRALLLALLLTSTAIAEEADRGFYVGADAAAIDAGAARRYGLLAATPDIVRVFPESTAVSGTDASWGIQAGYRFHRYLSLELAYVDYGSMVVHQTYDLSAIPNAPPRFESDVYFAAAGASLSWLAQIPFGERFEALVRVGILHAEQEIEPLSIAVLPGQSFFKEVTDNVPIYGIGAAYRMSDDWSVRAEYQYIEGLHGGDSIDGTDSVGPMRIGRYGLGIAYRF